jgi:translation initiation factor IF-1
MTLRRWSPRSPALAFATTELPLVLAILLLGAAAWSAWAAYATVALPTRDELFEIPKGTWARRMAGDKVEILPSRVELTQGANDVLLLRNLDDVPQIFGPVLIMPGQSFRLPFESVSENDFACTAHASGQMKVSVVAMPAPGWARLQWRARRLVQHSFLSGILWKN